MHMFEVCKTKSSNASKHEQYVDNIKITPSIKINNPSKYYFIFKKKREAKFSGKKSFNLVN